MFVLIVDGVRLAAQCGAGCEPADLVIANIHHAIVSDLFEIAEFRNHRSFIISGLMRSQARDVKMQVEKYGLRVIKEWDHEMTWFTMLIQNVK